jgi:hypothetical protein
VIPAQAVNVPDGSTQRVNKVVKTGSYKAHSLARRACIVKTPMQQWLEPIAPHGFRVFVQPPPQFDVVSANPSKPQRLACLPERLLNYVGRYVGGGPIAGHRLVRWENGYVTFLARSRDEEEEDGQLMLFSTDQPDNNPTPETKHQEPSTNNSTAKNSAATGINLPLSVTKSKEEITISEEEFVKRWAIHILPKGFMRVQHYGATSRRKGTEYLAKCRKMLGIEEPAATSSKDSKSAKSKDKSKPLSADDLEDVLKLMYAQEQEEKPYEPTWKCTKCGKLMECLQFQLRPSWRVIFERHNPQADKDTQQWLWSASELYALRNGATEHSATDPERKTKNQEQRSYRFIVTTGMIPLRKKGESC